MHADNRIRLMQIIDFARAELKDLAKYNGLSLNEYRDNKDTRRLVDRIIENATNALIDAAKIIIIEQTIELPDSYAGIMEEVSRVLELSEEQRLKLIQISKLRNILAHEYLNIKFERITDFILDGRKTAETVLKKAAEKL
ncbi:MAG: HepT-like ribonuclease domain-containing protein [bacterium]